MVNDYPLAHSAKVRTNDAAAIENLIEALSIALAQRRTLTDAERESEKSFRKKFLPESFVHQFRLLTEI